MPQRVHNHRSNVSSDSKSDDLLHAYLNSVRLLMCASWWVSTYLCSMFVCMFVYVLLCAMFLGVFVCVIVRMCAPECVCVCVWVWMRVCLCVRARVYLCVFCVCIFVCMFVSLFVCDSFGCFMFVRVRAHTLWPYISIERLAAIWTAQIVSIFAPFIVCDAYCCRCIRMERATGVHSVCLCSTVQRGHNWSSGS